METEHLRMFLTRLVFSLWSMGGPLPGETMIMTATLDLFISRGTDNGSVRQTLYRNNGDGTFTEVTDQAGLGSIATTAPRHGETLITTVTWTCMWSIPGVIPRGKGPNYLYRNNQDGTFTDVARAGVGDLVASRGRGAAWGDYDNDGFLDLFVTNGEDGKLNLRRVRRFSTITKEIVMTGLRLSWWEQRVIDKG